MYFTTKLPLGGVLIRIDVDPVKLSDQYAADVCIWSDARAALQSINHALASRLQDAPARSGWRTAIGGAAKIRAEIDGSLDSKARAQWSALRAIKAALPGDGVVFSDMTQIAYFGNYAYPVENPGQWFHPSGYGTLGFALPAALGAKISSPARAVIALAGDFGLQFTLPEFMTAVETGLEPADRGVEQFGAGPDPRRHGCRRHSATRRDRTQSRLRRAGLGLRRAKLPGARPGRAHRGDSRRPDACRTHLDRSGGIELRQNSGRILL